MNKNNILKKFILLGTITSVGLIPIIAVSCYEDNKKTIKPTTPSVVADTPKLPEVPKNPEAPKLPEVPKNPEAPIPPISNNPNPTNPPLVNNENMPEDISKVLSGVNVSIDKNASDQTVLKINKENIMFSGYDVSKYDVLIEEIIKDNENHNIKVKFLITDKQTKQKSSVREYQDNEFSTETSQEAILEYELSFVSLDYPNKEKITSLKADKNLLKTTGYNETKYEIEIVNLKPQAGEFTELVVEILLKDKESGTSKTVEKTIEGFKSREIAVDLNMKAKNIVLDVEGKENILLGKTKIGDLKITSNLSDEYLLVIKDRKGVGNKLEVSYTVTKKDDKDKNESDKMTYTIMNFKTKRITSWL